MPDHRGRVLVAEPTLVDALDQGRLRHHRAPPDRNGLQPPGVHEPQQHPGGGQVKDLEESHRLVQGRTLTGTQPAGEPEDPCRGRLPEPAGEGQRHAQRAGERSHSGMQAIARSLSDQDIADLAAFYGSGK